MLSIIVSMLPILIATFCLLIKRSTCQSMTVGIIAGIIIFLIKNGFSYNNIARIGNTAIITICDNITVLLSIFLLFTLVFLIRNSRVIDALNTLSEEYINSPKRIIIFMIFFGIVFSLDDYLACMAMGAIFTDAATRQGFSKEKTAYMINIIAVSCCCLSPFSSWMPVIKSAISITGINEAIVYQTLPFNFSALLGLALVIIVCCFCPNAFNSIQFYKKESKIISQNKTKKKLSFEMIAFIIVFSILIFSLLSMTFLFSSGNAVIKSTVISIIVAVPLFIYAKAINLAQIKSSIKNAIESTWDLGKLLLSIWLLTNVCNTLLNLSDIIIISTKETEFPMILLPVAIFILAGIFSFLTGSSYGTFGLFIPLTIQLTYNEPIFQNITIAAAISGSLMAANSFASDTLKLVSKSTQSNMTYLQFAQLPYGILLYFLGIISFLIAGICVPYSKLWATIIPNFVSISLCIAYLVILPQLRTEIDETIYRLFVPASGKGIQAKILKDKPYPINEYTFHSKYSNRELLIIINVRILLSRITVFYSKPYPLKMPGVQ